ncbi:hypothetical protein JXB27_00650 [Candidatus Woesearchaeota archaeon]|nr:hypothetical protein [Candidatus Woesearchaeota archaeon]
MDKKDLLTITATEWAKTSGKSLRNYVAVGLQFSGIAGFEGFVTDHILQEVPKRAEVVVSYKLNVERIERYKTLPDYRYNAVGTALIPKKTHNKAHKNK